jgi:hypothetical protein
MQGKGIENTLKEQWERDIRSLGVKVRLELWEGEDFISRFSEDFIKGFYKWSLSQL